jgi:hypothetical protein
LALSSVAAPSAAPLPGASWTGLITPPIRVITMPICVITSAIRVITMTDPHDHDAPIRAITTRRSA